ncbi:MAG: hypothetical protein Q8N01_10035 [Sulfuricurvum sp.]|nr:hypothetical protein [Sulfuricurvum sp.]
MTIAVVSHDAGCSQLLYAMIDQHRHHDVIWQIFAHSKSPMALICERNSLPFTPIDDAVQQLEVLKPDALFFGTGWQEKVERPYVAYCKEHGIPTIAFLDHWSSYRERFGYPDDKWETNCGDFTAVHDEKALQLALDLHLPNPIALPNLYLQKLIHEAKSKNIPQTQNLLFLSEPTDAVAKSTYGDENYWGFTQYTALEDILKNFERFECSGLTIRLHPSEKSSGFKRILQKYPHVRVQINDANTFELAHQLLSAKIILGFDTMALYTAALMGKNVISYLPSSNRSFLLPLPSSQQFRTLKGLKPSHLSPIALSLENFGMDFALFLETLTKGH